MSNRKGFTLIELLIVVVIIGILAAIAIPKFANTKEKAYIAAMKSDLRNLLTAQESYFADNTLYEAGTASPGTPLPGSDWQPSAGVTVVVTANSGLGWAATATHTGTTQSCGIATGSESNPVDATAAEGEPKCA
jgi:prepilin-type N-terminal cleavage/methylation domain-containing protein